ncbi:MAG TPA: ABC transporter permease [Solirubrobacteraceae bacterium]|nr:ABC transporter permease [Solirubrobacteraceae bacterium]
MATQDHPRTGLDLGALLAPVREVGDIAEFSGRAIAAAPGSMRHFGEVLRQMGILIVGTALVLLALEALIGGECALFFVYLSRPIGAGSFTGFFEVPCGIRELYPYMFGYIFSAKVGCGLVAEIGSMRISNEIDALEAIGMDPMRFIIGTRLLAIFAFIPLIYGACILVGTYGGAAVSVLQIGELTSARFFQGYWSSQGLVDNLQSLVKTMSIGMTIALVGCYYGYKARGGPVGVGEAVARSMIVNLIMIHLLGAFWSQVFYSHGANYPFGG